MLRNLRYLFVTCIFAVVCLGASATPSATPPATLPHVDSIRTEIHFRWDKATLDTLYMGNDKTLRFLNTTLDSIGLHNIDSVVIISQSSPEGQYRHNQKLSTRRASTMRTYMENRHPALTDKLTVNPDGESWMQLREYVSNDKRLKDESIARILRIIDDNSVSIDTKKWRISHDPVYRYLLTTYYPRIRNSQMLVLYVRERFQQPQTKLAPVERPVKISSPIQFRERLVQSALKNVIAPDTFTFALKTNMLYDVATALNVELEVPIGNHWSVMVEDVFPWWEKDNKYCFEMWEMGLEGRYWFRNNRWHADKLRGHFVGLYGMSSKYDFQWDRKACYQGEYWSVGVTYGYGLKVHRNVNLEFSLSVGYLSSAYRHYFPADDYSVLWRDYSKQGRVSYVGPTKLKVSLVVPIRVPYHKKGGLR